MAFKDYKNDYEHPKIPIGHRHIEPKESFEIDYIYEEILYRNKMILETSGDICQIFRKKVHGTRCTNPECPAHENYQQEGSLDCPVCLGTGYVGGYDYVEEVYVRFPLAEEKIALSQDGIMRVVKPIIWTMPEPKLRQFDIIIDFSQPQVVQEETIVDKEITREIGTSFDVLDDNIGEFRQLVRIIKISNNANSSEDYKYDIDYELSNNGILWKTDNRPEDYDSYFVTYEVTNSHYRRYEITAVKPSPWRGRILSQRFDVTELNITHPSYKIPAEELGNEEINIIYNPFPTSKWFDRTT